MREMRKDKRRCKQCLKDKKLNKENFKQAGANKKRNKAKIAKQYFCRVCRVCEKENRVQPDCMKLVNVPEQKYLCISEPFYSGYLGKYINKDNMEETLRMGYMPPGSQWFLAEQGVTFAVRGNEDEVEYRKQWLEEICT